MMRNLYKIDWTKFDPHTTVFLLIKYKKSICFQLFIEFEEVGLFILVFDWKCCWSLIFFLQKWLGFLWQGISWYNWIILSIMWHFTHDFILFLSMIFDIRFPLCCLFQWHLTFSFHYIVFFNDIWHSVSIILFISMIFGIRFHYVVYFNDIWHSVSIILFISMTFDIQFPLYCLFQWHLTFCFYYIV